MPTKSLRGTSPSIGNQPVRQCFAEDEILVFLPQAPAGLHERDQGLTVAKFNKSTSNYSLQYYKVLNKNTGSGNLGSNSVYSIVEDLDGKIWVGTSAGIRVFNSPNTILTGGPVDGEPIKIVQDGNVELLLDAEGVTCIDVDAANNKWRSMQLYRYQIPP